MKFQTIWLILSISLLRLAFAACEVDPRFQPIDPKQANTTSIMAQGQLGGGLCPTQPVAMSRSYHQAEHQAFAEAMNAWNAHEYDKAVMLMKDYLSHYPNGIWSGEAELHLGCEARFNGRYQAANQYFNNLINRYQASNNPSSQQLANKSLSRLAVLRVLENDLVAAGELFNTLLKSEDWRLRTYARGWLVRLSQMQANEVALADCGYQALQTWLAYRGIEADFSQYIDTDNKDSNQHTSSGKGQSVSLLQALAKRYGITLTALQFDPSQSDFIKQFAVLPLPAIVPIPREHGSGHYWLIESRTDDVLTLYDAQAGRRFTQSISEFLQEWQGVALAFLPEASTSEKNLTQSLNQIDLERLNALILPKEQADEIFGGCCGIQRPEDNLGRPGSRPGNPAPSGDEARGGGCNAYGCPRFLVNPANLNFYVYDTPIWYQSPLGLPLTLTLHYNSQSALAHHEPFGHKWSSSFTSTVVEDPGKTATVFMPDGKRLVFTQDGKGGFSSSYGTRAALLRVDHGYQLLLSDGIRYHYASPEGTGSQQVFLTRISNALGWSLSLVYNKQLQLTQVIDAMGRTLDFDYDSSGHVLRVTAPEGLSAQFEYSAKGDLTAITDSAGYRSSFDYDDDKIITAIHKPQGTWQFKTEPADNIRNNSIVYPAPDAPMWENYRITVTDPSGAKSEYYYDGYHGSSWYVAPNDYVAYQDNQVNNYTKAAKTTFRYQNKKGVSRLTQYTAADKTSYQYQYDAAGFVTRVNEMGQLKTTYQYDKNHLPVRVDRQGVMTTLAYQNIAGLEKIVKMETISSENTLITPATIRSRLQTTNQYNAQGQVILHETTPVVDKNKPNSTEEATRSLHYGYNAQGQLTQVQYPDGTTMKLDYYPCGIYLPTDLTATVAVNSIHDNNACQLRSITRADGGVTRFEDYQRGLPTRVILPNGLITHYRYDALSRVVSSSEYDGKHHLATTNYYYSMPSQPPTRVELATGEIIEYRYDAHNHLLSVADSQGNRIDYQRDKNGNVIARNVTGQDGVLIAANRYQYDVLDRITVIENAEGLVTNRYRYTATGKLMSVVDGLNQAIRFYYDRLDYLREVAAPLSQITRYENLATGEVATVTDPLSRKTHYQYNAFGEKLAIMSPDSGLTTEDYNDRGQLISHTDARGVTVSYDYDDAGRIWHIHYPAATSDDEDETVTYHYYPAYERRLRITDADGESDYRYNARGQVISHQRRLAKTAEVLTTKYHYRDDSGQLQAITYPSGRTVRYDYGDGKQVSTARIHRVTLSQGLWHKRLADEIYYNALGQLVALRYGNERVESRTYDSNGRLVLLQQGDIANRYDYDLRDNLVMQTETGHNPADPEKVRKTTIHYDGLSRITNYEVKEDEWLRLRYQYDALSNRIHLQIERQPVPNQAIDRTVVQYQYQADAPAGRGRLTQINERVYHNNKPTNAQQSDPSQDIPELIDWRTTLAKYRGQAGKRLLLRCKENGQIRPIWGSGLYTDLSPVCSAAVHQGLIDAKQGGIFYAVIEPGQSRYVSSTQNGVSSRSYYAYWFGSYRLAAYRAANRVEAGVTQQGLDYDAAGNLTQYPPLSLQYNGRNRLLSAQNSETGVNATYRYRHDGLRSSKTVNDVRTDYVYAPSGEILAWRRGNVWHERILLGDRTLAYIHNGKIYYNETDYQGKTERLMDDQGVAVESLDWLPYRLYRETGDLMLDYQPRFAGQLYDEETGLYYNHYREYAPSLGRYTQPDPIGLDGGINLYGYAEGNPIMWDDFWGLDVYRCQRKLAIFRGGKFSLGPEDGVNLGAGGNGHLLYHEYLCVTLPRTPDRIRCFGQTAGEWGFKGKEDDSPFEAEVCHILPFKTKNSCYERCLYRLSLSPRKNYNFGVGTNCQVWTRESLTSCADYCSQTINKGDSQ